MDEHPLGCSPAETTYAIDHADLTTVEGVSQTPAPTGKLAHLPTDLAWTVKVAQCDDKVRVTLGRPDNALPQFHSAVGSSGTGGAMFATDGNGRVPLAALADATAPVTGDGWRTGDLMTVEATRTGDELEGVVEIVFPTTVVKEDLAAYRRLTLLSDGDVLIDGVPHTSVAFKFHATAMR